MKRILFLSLMVIAVVLCLITSTAGAQDTALPTIDASKWQYNEADGVYWQVGISYCANPADETYETLGVFVPSAYMNATDNGDGTFTCAIDAEATIAGYSAATAPIVIPVDTPGYSAMRAPTDYVSTVKSYTDAGFVYVMAGCRGRDAGAPAGVTDLKAAVRFLRYSAETLPGSTDRIFTFGMSGGGAQSALVGATGDSALYEPYLEAIGAVSGYSDAVTGSMCWCPITNLDTADAAYEWNLGLTRTGLDEQTQALSDGLVAAYGEYINTLGLTDADGLALTIDSVEAGIRDTGSYVEAVRSLIETSLNHFLEDTEFPYTPSSGKGNFGGGRNGMPDLADGEIPDFNGEGPDGDERGTLPDLNGGQRGERTLTAEDWENGTVDDGIMRMQTQDSAAEAVTYETAQAYIDSLNADEPWIVYDSESNTATVTSVEGFVKACKPATKSVGAFDDLNCAQGENTLFGYGDGQGAHFDATMATLLENTEYADAFANDLARTDALGTSVETRLLMYTPLYYLNATYDGYQTANVAPYWRIRTGITQGDTALTTEMNLALALEAYGADVDFETIWAQGHVEAERTGSSTENFIAWVNACLE
ncbi:MAG: subtype A tannase [Clostridia bacterium]|nr:subtype A tannase [Clostridia bacterium]